MDRQAVMLVLLLIVAVVSAVETAPMPRPHLAVADTSTVYLSEPFVSPSGLPWQTVIAPYLERSAAPATWDRR